MATSETANLDHQGLEVLSPDECWAKIRETPVGRVAFVEAGQPVILPVNHGVHGHRIVFRTARGALLHEAVMSKPIAFEVDGFDPDTRAGWSVLARGEADVPEAVDALDELGLDAWADAVNRDEWVSILVEELSGRRIDRPH